MLLCLCGASLCWACLRHDPSWRPSVITALRSAMRPLSTQWFFLFQAIFSNSLFPWKMPVDSQIHLPSLEKSDEIWGCWITKFLLLTFCYSRSLPEAKTRINDTRQQYEVGLRGPLFKSISRITSPQELTMASHSSTFTMLDFNHIFT